MNIIGGTLKGRKIISIPNVTIRPTSGKIKESIFSILSNIINDSNVLDLFAGTGALGIEALSRGAKTSVFIDSGKEVIKNIKKNLSSLNLNYLSYIFRWNILKNLNCLVKLNINFRIVFIDPPYYQNMINSTLVNLINANVLEPKACVVIEHTIEDNIPNELSSLVLIDQRIYGKTVVSFYSLIINK